MPNGFTIPIPFIGPLTIHFYGVIIIIGALAAAWLASVEARRRGQNSETVWDALLWILLGGIIGARLWHIFTPPPSMVAMGITTKFYLTHPLDAIAVWNGGLGIPGAIIGGGLALFIYCRAKKLDFLVWIDIAAPAIALGQAIGRWGNFVNQELYGRPTTLPWGITISSATGYPVGTRFHPLFLYESIYNLLNMAFLLWLGRRHDDKLLPGDLFLIYLITYPIGRFLLEFLRLDAAQVAGLNINQTIMLVVAISSAVIILYRHQRQRVLKSRRKNLEQN
ncbi:MAG: lgt [Chloroflexi bacterium]|jgi:phosphatidylglycerol:prolipoprotein diacylglycerol transferase|nr:lgt [Chloroflexota bacterium]